MIKLNGEMVIFTRFPNGEVKVPMVLPFLDKRAIVEIAWLYENDAELLHLQFLRSIIPGDVILHLPYVPYSRMDRVSVEQPCLSLKVLCAAINAMNFIQVRVIDPHSDVATALLENVCVVNFAPLQANILGIQKGTEYVCFPDSSAYKRYGDFFEHHKHVIGVKNRNFETGALESVGYSGLPEEKQESVIIVDDLCSRGGTFMAACDKLETHFKEIYLVVGHMENVVNPELIGRLAGVVTSNSLYSESPYDGKIRVIGMV